VPATAYESDGYTGDRLPLVLESAAGASTGIVLLEGDAGTQLVSWPRGSSRDCGAAEKNRQTTPHDFKAPHHRLFPPQQIRQIHHDAANRAGQVDCVAAFHMHDVGAGRST
jgi:hypothetical protein